MSKNYAISFKFTLLDKMTVPAKGLAVSMGNLSKNAAAASKSMSGLNGETGSMTGSVFKGILGFSLFSKGLQLVKTGFMKVVDEASKFENSLASFTTLLAGNEKAAKKLVDELKILGARTPFEFQDLADATTMLLGFGAVTEDTAVDTLRQLGDLAQGSKVRLEGIARAYGQIASGGKANMQDINQLINNQVPILQQLAKQWGFTGKNAIGQARKMVESGKATSEEITKAFKIMTSKGGLFYKGSERAAKTFTGRMSSLMDVLNMTAAGIGDALMPVLKDLIDQVTIIAEKVLAWVNDNQKLINDSLEKLVNVLSIVWEIIKFTVQWFIKAIEVIYKLRYVILIIVSALGAYKAALIAINIISWIKYLWMMRTAILAAAKAQWVLNFAMSANPIALIIMGVAALVAIVYVLYENWDDVVKTIKEAIQWVREFLGLTGDVDITAGVSPNAQKAAKNMNQSKTDINLKVSTDPGTTVKTEKVSNKGTPVKLNTVNGGNVSPMMLISRLGL